MVGPDPILSLSSQPPGRSPALWGAMGWGLLLPAQRLMGLSPQYVSQAEASALQQQYYQWYQHYSYAYPYSYYYPAVSARVAARESRFWPLLSLHPVHSHHKARPSQRTPGTGAPVSSPCASPAGAAWTAPAELFSVDSPTAAAALLTLPLRPHGASLPCPLRGVLCVCPQPRIFRVQTLGQDVYSPCSLLYWLEELALGAVMKKYS